MPLRDPFMRTLKNNNLDNFLGSPGGPAQTRDRAGGDVHPQQGRGRGGGRLHRPLFPRQLRRVVSERAAVGPSNFCDYQERQQTFLAHPKNRYSQTCSLKQGWKIYVNLPWS